MKPNFWMVIAKNQQGWEVKIGNKEGLTKLQFIQDKRPSFDEIVREFELIKTKLA